MSSADHEVDRDLLADYLGGALAGTQENDYVAHLTDTSPQWRAAAEEMRAAFDLVDRDLAVLRDQPEEMPADIAARFDEMFAPPKLDPLAARPVGRSGGRKRKWKRWAAPIAVAAAAAAFFGLGQVPKFTANLSETTAGAPGRANTEAVPPGADMPAAASGNLPPTIYTGAEYTRQDLRSRLEGKESSPNAFSQDTSALREAWQRFQQPQALSTCLSAVSAVLPGQPTLVELAYFEGRPALVISITTFSGGWRFIAGTGCGQAGADELFRTPR